MKTSTSQNPVLAQGQLLRTSGRYSLFFWEGRYQVIEHTTGQDYILSESTFREDGERWYGDLVLAEAKARAETHRRPHVLGIERK